MFQNLIERLSEEELESKGEGRTEGKVFLWQQALHFLKSSYIFGYKVSNKKMIIKKRVQQMIILLFESQPHQFQSPVGPLSFQIWKLWHR